MEIKTFSQAPTSTSSYKNFCTELALREKLGFVDNLPKTVMLILTWYNHYFLNWVSGVSFSWWLQWEFWHWLQSQFEWKENSTSKRHKGGAYTTLLHCLHSSLMLTNYHKNLPSGARSYPLSQKKKYCSFSLVREPESWKKCHEPASVLKDILHRLFS